MPKTFYTERDIEDLYNSGVKSLVVDDTVVVTDLGREKAMKLGFELIREFDQPQDAPIRPYITEKRSPSAAPPASGIPSTAGSLKAPKASPPAKPDLETRVFEAVSAKLGGSVDPQLLRVIIQRVIRNLGKK